MTQAQLIDAKARRRAIVLLIVALIMLVAWDIFIFKMSAKTGTSSQGMSMGIVGRIVRFVIPGYESLDASSQKYWYKTLNFIIRKGAHVTEYAVLSAVIANAIIRVLNLVHTLRATRSTDAACSPQGTPTKTRASLIERIFACDMQGRAKLIRLGIASFVLSVAYAAADEIHQLWIPGRTGQISDVGVDAIGSCIGAIIVCVAIALVRRHRAKRAAGE